MSKVLILTSRHLWSSPRSQKEAEALSGAGHNVLVLGIWFDPRLIRWDRQLLADKKWRFEPIIDFSPSHRMRNLYFRIRRRMAKECFSRVGLFMPELLGYGIREMLKAARKSKADLIIVRSEEGLWVADRLLKEGFRVGIDFEDWFSKNVNEDDLYAPVKKLIRIETNLAKNCKYFLTSSRIMAEAIAKTYNVSTPSVMYNVFPWSERERIDGKIKDRKDINLPSLHWFSQTIGRDRGLGILMKSLAYLKVPLEIHLRGNYPESSRRWLEPLIPSDWRSRIFIHPTVSYDELLSRIAEHDIGLSLEDSRMPNREFTIANKFFQYLQAGVAVIATATAGHCEIFSGYAGIGRLIPVGHPEALAEAIESLVCSPADLKKAKESALQAARDRFCWEKERRVVLSAAESALI
jgi:glycosyltransferase involved in cell wall biosynthesis